MAALTPATLIRDAKRVVIKIGSALLVDPEAGALRNGWLMGLATDIAAMKERGQDVVVVSSGSIALGRRVLSLDDGPLSLEHSQAAASVGQIKLARAYEAALADCGITTAQVLMTLEDSENRRRYLNSRATLQTLLSLGAVPIVNENDTVATDEIRFGDNDRLAAQVAVLCGAELLCLMSDVDGLYDRNPSEPDAMHLDLITAITPEVEAMAGDAASQNSRGGMRTKLMAASTSTAAGCAMVIHEGAVDRPLHALERGARATLFAARETPAAARKNWIVGMVPRGFIEIDDGAVAALRRGKSLLPAGVRQIDGTFDRGDAVEVRDITGAMVARGLIEYNAEEARAIAGAQSAEIEGILGHPGRAALIHRDDLVI